MPFPPLIPPFARALAERDYQEPTSVQTAVLAPDMAGRDLLVSAQTGSGKTIAFGLAIGSTLLHEREVLERAGDPAALIVAPTRELALQVQRELTWLYQYVGARIVSCVGGMDPQQERRQLNSGCHIVVGTPGRLRDHLERGNLRLAGLKVVVLDEADEMLDLGFRDDLEYILKATPGERRSLLFSATLPKEIVKLAKQFQHDAQRIATSAGERAHADIEYRAVAIAAHDVEHAVVNLLRFFNSPTTLVFCNTREAVRHLHATLLERGFSTVSLSGEASQHERNHALQALRDGKAAVCVATDVAARGLDLPSLALVIHADLPNDAETLQHRSGRTGRAGRKGISILLVTPPRRRRAEQMLTTMGIRAAWGAPPTADEIRKLDDTRLLEKLLAADVGEADDMVLAKTLLARRSAEEIAAVLVRLHRAQLPAPEDIAELSHKGRDERPNRDSHVKRKESWRREGQAGASPDAAKVWFRLNVGRSKKADPKWLIPEICRQGGVTKRDIGVIRIFDDETLFEIFEQAAGKFAARVAKATAGEMRIEAGAAPGGDARGSLPRSYKKSDKPRGDAWKPKFTDKFKKRPGKDSHAGHRKGPKP